MKTRLALLVLLSALFSTSAFAADPPLITLTVEDHELKGSDDFSAVSQADGGATFPIRIKQKTYVVRIELNPERKAVRVWISDPAILLTGGQTSGSALEVFEFYTSLPSDKTLLYRSKGFSLYLTLNPKLQ